MTTKSNVSAWFTEAKQALSIAGPICSEASLSISTTNKQVEHASVLWSRIVFMIKANKQQLHMLQKVRSSLTNIHESSCRESDAIFRGFNNLEDRLKKALINLDRTTLDPSFSSRPGNLRQFVHEEGIEHVQQQINDLKLESKNTQKQIRWAISQLDDDISLLHEKSSKLKDPKRTALEKAHQSNDSIANEVRGMAMLLESLTRHYDLSCRANELIDLDDEESRNELNEIIPILSKDSQEAEEVIEELYGRRETIQNSENAVAEFFKEMTQIHQQVKEFYTEFDEFCANKLDIYSSSLMEFSKNHQSQSLELNDLVRELESLATHYEMFSKSYYAMILEVLRRKKSHDTLLSQIDAMNASLDKQYENELEARKRFVRDQGNFLPSDIWEGLTESLERASILVPNVIIPKLSESTIAKAIKEF